MSQTAGFIIFVTMTGHKYKLFKNILNDFLTKGKGEINMAKINYSKMYFDTISVEGLKSMFYDWFNNCVLPSMIVK